MSTTADEYRTALRPELLAKFRQLAKLLRRPGRGLGDYHAAGLLVRALVPLETTYGTGSVDNLAAALADPDKEAAGLRSLLYRLLKLAKYYPDGLPAGAAGRLSWEAMKPVLAVPDEAQREALLAGILASESVPSLREVQALARRRKPARPPAEPTEKKPTPAPHPNDALRDLQLLLRRWSKVYADWGRGSRATAARVGRLRAEQRQAFRAGLEEAVDGLAGLSRQARSLARELRPLTKPDEE
ncbi:hypothetical protein [Urbifossiella limnaea]|uniref:Uncharacterized protein n=1 Tax=Urbifossiella limnaea TaxID=2528023 RepID=A0A517XN69_9BACT|nr:hypothetical protein [Urbifossiella limnaea]QDU18951.1 hypothetical protein ETAA1_08500 [Urbifossiella limnaea]